MSWSLFQIQQGIDSPLKNIIKHIRFGLMTESEMETIVKPTNVLEKEEFQKYSKKDYSSIHFTPRSLSFVKIFSKNRFYYLTPMNPKSKKEIFYSI
jgi:hypothetical protein